MNIKKIALITLLSTTPLSAFASTVTGPYISMGAGYDLTQTQHGHTSPGSFANGTGSTAGASSRFRHHDGFSGYGTVGYGFGNGFRAEIEGGYFQSQINQVSHTAAPGKTSGVDQNYGALVNVLYDIDLKKNFGIDSPITPYVGVGAGYLWSGLNGVNTGFANQNTRWSGTRGSFAYQGIVGASYDVPGVPGLALTADYRMIGQDFYNGAYNSGTSGRGGFHSGHVNFDPRFNHQFSIGLRYAFDTAPPAPQATVSPVIVPPTPAPARTYLVFFDWDSSVLSSRAKAIVESAAGASTHIQTTVIEVNGYTDNTSIHGGERGAKYNQVLSLKRANSVKAELIRDGVPSTAIDVHGYGETHPLVSTGPNTREAQNRRVEIILK